MKIEDVKVGQSVAYVPMHAKCDYSHPDIDLGVVTSKDDKSVFVRFNRNVIAAGTTNVRSQGCNPEDLISVKFTSIVACDGGTP